MIADISKDLLLLESTLQRVLQSQQYADMIRQGLCNPEFSLLAALHAVQQCSRQLNNNMNPKMKPIGYYTNPAFEDKSILLNLEEQYGSYFQTLNRSEKLSLIALIAADLLKAAPLTESIEISTFISVGQRAEALTTENREGLLEALINGVRYQL